MNKAKNVLMVLPNLRVNNGVASYAMNYFRKVDRSAFCIDFVVYRDIPNPYNEEIIKSGSSIYVLSPLSNPVKHFKECFKILSQKKYEIVHDNSLIITYPLMLAAKIKNVPIRILHSHGSKLGETTFKEVRNRLALPFLIKTATHFAACSQIAGKAMFGSCAYSYIPNAIEPYDYIFDVVKRNVIRSELGVMEDQIVIATVGRTAPQKNPFFALQIMEAMIHQCPNVQYWWIGSGPMDEVLQKYVADRGLSNRVKFLGSRSDMRELYQAVDVFFLPSLFEGLPVTSIEAQAMGLPCVLSDSITNELVYTENVTYVSLDENADFWVESLKRAALQIRKDESEALIKSVFNINNSIRTLISLYNLEK